jgi:phenylacetate-CoA ligase
MSFISYIKRKKFWINDFSHGGKMWKHFKEIMFIINNPEEGEEIRKRKLYELIEFACTNTKFYSKIKSKKLSDFPIINKQIILDNYDDFIVPKEKIPGQVGDVHVQSTSGSTGTPFKVFQDTNCRIRRIATIKAENELVGFHSFDLLMHFRALSRHYSYGKDIVWNKQHNIIYVDNANLNEERIKRIIDIINTKNVKFVRGYVTAIDTVTMYAVEHKLKLSSHPLFITGGEMLTESLKDRIVDGLNCSVISQYANEENGVFGQSEINGCPTTMNLNRANCYIEILKLDSDKSAQKGELGRIVVTDLTNYAMPLIRYDIGDLARIGDVTESGILLSIESLAGRKTDMILKTNGLYVDFFNSISGEIAHSTLIKQWQFVQNSEKEYLLNLCLQDKTLESNKEHYIELVKDVVGEDAIVEIKFLEEIPILNSGKRKLIINNWKK